MRIFGTFGRIFEALLTGNFAVSRMTADSVSDSHVRNPQFGKSAVGLLVKAPLGPVRNPDCRFPGQRGTLGSDESSIHHRMRKLNRRAVTGTCIRALCDNGGMTSWDSFADALRPSLPRKVVVSERTLHSAIENALMSYTRSELEVVLADELKIPWMHSDEPSDPSYTKRSLIAAYVQGWPVPRLVGLARRIVDECEVASNELSDIIMEYDKRGGTGSPAKNLIFAANGPKPELVLKDAVNNDIEIVKNADYCLILEQPIPADGLRYDRLIEWWRARQGMTGVDDRTVGLSLHDRLLESIGNNPVERLVFDVYARRYKEYGFGIPALIPQVYLHYDPYTARIRGVEGSPLARQRMDFLLLFSDRQRVVIEVDGKQHYSDPDGRANPSLYAAMVSEDRRLRLAGYDVYRFGGKELMSPDAPDMVSAFFEELSRRMS